MLLHAHGASVCGTPNFLVRDSEYNRRLPKEARLYCLKLRVAALVIVLSLTLTSHAQSAAPIRVAVVGLEHGHVYGFLSGLKEHPEVQLVAIVEPDTALAAKYEQQFKLDHALFYKDVDTMVPATKPQALLVYTNIAGHRPAIEAGARHHLTVMVEKPLTMSLADALSIRETARKANIQVLVNYETTWYSSNLAAYNAIEQGKLGDLRKVVIHDGHEGPKEIHVQPEFLSWLNDPTKNGQGALYDFGCYGADLMTWFMKGEAPISVTAVGQTDKPDIYGVYDDATIILALSQGAGRAHALMELALRPQRFRDLRCNRILRHRRPEKLPRAPRRRSRRNHRNRAAHCRAEL